MTEIPRIKLNKIISKIPVTFESSGIKDDIEVTGICFDSRNIKIGNIFIALKGGNFDGHKYIKDAIVNGASAIVGQNETLVDLGVPYIKVENSREAMAYVSAAYYGFPSKKLVVIGVTGTDGKTTTANIIYSILITAGIKAGMISTVNAVIGDRVLDTGFHVTTPESPFIQNYLYEMVQNGITHVVLEATSHGLAQERVTACDFDIGVVTNITHEHLDYHGDYESYFKAKAKLFKFLSTSVIKNNVDKLAVLNKDDNSFEKLNKIVNVKKVDYSVYFDSGDFCAKNIKTHKNGLQFDVIGNGIKQNIICPLPGDYNISNCMAAIGATVYGLGINSIIAAKGIQSMGVVPGRMEKIEMGQDFTAIVDFAHTPNALRSSLSAAKDMTNKKVIAIFGSAGLRDKQKRRMMAEISLKIADISILTAEDPRTESLTDILNEMSIAAEAQGGVYGKTYYVVRDRGEAILLGIQMASKGDIVIACGKGHEQSMCFGEIEYPWDDRQAMRSALAKVLNIEGPELPFLPTQISE